MAEIFYEIFEIPNYSLEHDLFASGSRDKTIKIWNFKNGKEINTLKGHSASVNSLAYLSDSLLASGNSWNENDGNSISVIKIWNYTSGQGLFVI